MHTGRAGAGPWRGDARRRHHLGARRDLREQRPMTAEQRWAALVETMLAQGAATYGSDGPQRAFGSTSLKTDGKIFAMLVKDRLVVKLDRRRVDELVEAGTGKRF